MTVTNLNAGSNSLSWSDNNIGMVGQRFYRLVETQTPALPLTNALLAVDAVPLQLINPGFDSSELAAGAVFLAAATNGTLVQSAAGWTYSASPSDRLIAQFTNGLTTTFFVSVIVGDFTGNSDNFLRNSHDFEFHVVTPSVGDLQVSSVVSGSSFAARAKGTLTYLGVNYAIDLTAAGQHVFNTDSTGTELTDDYGITGTITSTGFNLTVNQHHYFSLVESTHIATTAQEHLNSSLTIGADIYQWLNVYKRKDFTDGIPAYYTPGLSPLYWIATGQVSKNGAAYASYRYSDSPIDLYLRFFLDTPFGSIDLEDWVR
jgi:hypothetical protein